MKVARRGWDAFFFDPGTRDDVFCRICGAKCEAKRDCEGPTSYVMSISGNKRKHDSFYCPHIGKGWHEKAFEMRSNGASILEVIATLMHEDEGV